MPVGLFRSSLLVVLFGLGACRGAGPSAPGPPGFGPGLSLPAPSLADGADDCLDVAGLRVCWPAEGRPPRLLPRAVPPLDVPGGWRCWGAGEARRCRPRAVGAGPWRCQAGGGCRRVHPRRPDDGEWECTETAGVVICRHHGESAGVIAGPPDPAWRCGGDPRICVDLSPDLPPGHEAGDLVCRFTLAPGEPRACVSPGPEGAPRVGQACAAQTECPEATACLSGHCLPPRAPAPTCWTSRDCGGGACRLGQCEEGAP
ncbi:MAG: hypothetical protein P1V51_09350 [Deltaproteobacteria bacterium]|nr:hypothetical protein [Deltaproteobacteria bacterium]